MIDALFKTELDQLWDHVGRSVARTGVGPNAVTVAAFALSTGNSLLLLLHRNLLAFGLALVFTELLDSVDGAVARATGRASRFGSYLDAITGRYKEVCVVQREKNHVCVVDQATVGGLGRAGCENHRSSPLADGAARAHPHSRRCRA